MPRMPTLEDVNAARARLRSAVLETPLEASPALAVEIGAAAVRLKREELQTTGAFKARGARNKIAVVAESHPEAALVTASSGNHGIAVATAAAEFGMRVTVLVGRSISAAKLERLRGFETGRCTVELFGDDTDDAEAEARRRDDAGHAIYVPPYNDAEVVAGQATVGVEMLEAWPDVDTIVVPVGGGGLIAGIGLWAKAVRPNLRLIGVQPSASPPMYAFFQTGSPAPMPIGPTLAEGVAGNIERGSITWALCREVVDEMVVVEEHEIVAAMRWSIDVAHVLLEPSAALGIAAARSNAGASWLAGARVAIVTTGRNVTLDVVRGVLGA